MTAVALFGFSCSKSLFWLCLFAIPLGLGAGAIDSALNNYVALYYKAVHMNFLHCFYGIGVSLSPYLMSFALSHDANWRKGYHIVFCLQFMIALITIFSLPLWNKIKNSSLEREQENPRTVSIFELLKIPAVRSVCFVFLESCAIKYTAGIWGATFLVHTKGMDVNYAAKMITFYYMGIASGRFLSGVLSNKLTRWQLIKIGQYIMAAAIILLLFPLPPIISVISLFMIGMGNAPSHTAKFWKRYFAICDRNRNGIILYRYYVRSCIFRTYCPKYFYCSFFLLSFDPIYYYDWSNMDIETKTKNS